MKWAAGTDHRGVALKDALVGWLREQGHDVEDCGPYDTTSCDYPDYAIKVAGAVADGVADRGVLICGTGLGMSYAANRLPGVRAALCCDISTARMSRYHNDANILVLPGDTMTVEQAIEMLEVWIAEPFEGGRHIARIRKIDTLAREWLENRGKDES